MKKSYAASIILGTVCGFMAVITSPLHPIACPFLIIGYLFFILYPVANYIEEKGVPKWVYELLHYRESENSFRISSISLFTDEVIAEAIALPSC